MLSEWLVAGPILEAGVLASDESQSVARTAGALTGQALLVAGVFFLGRAIYRRWVRHKFGVDRRR